MRHQEGAGIANWKEVLDEPLNGAKRPEDLLGNAGPIQEMKFTLLELMPQTELMANLGYEEGN